MLHDPASAVSVCPCTAEPVSFGCAVDASVAAYAATGPTSDAYAACFVPFPSVAVIVSPIVLPASLLVRRNVAAVAPCTDAQCAPPASQRYH